MFTSLACFDCAAVTDLCVAEEAAAKKEEGEKSEAEKAAEEEKAKAKKEREEKAEQVCLLRVGTEARGQARCSCWPAVLASARSFQLRPPAGLPPFLLCSSTSSGGRLARV